MSFFTALIFLSVFLCGASWVDVAYITYPIDGSISYVTQDSSGDFHTASQVISVDGYTLTASHGATDEAVFLFRHKWQKKLLTVMGKEISGTDSDSKKHIIAVFDPADMSAPLASCDIWETGGLSEKGIYGFAEFGSNILLQCHRYAVAEVNPETCAVVSSYDIPTYNLTVHKNMIYVTSSDYWGGDYFGNGTQHALMVMDRLGHITGRVNSVAGRILSSGKNLYIDIHGTIYRIISDISRQDITSADFFSSYAQKIIDTGWIDAIRTDRTICPDDRGGLYYVNSSGDIAHIEYLEDEDTDAEYYDDDGNKISETNETIYVNESGDVIVIGETPKGFILNIVYTPSKNGHDYIHWLRHDSSSGNMFVTFGNIDYGMAPLAVLSQDSEGNFTLSEILGYPAIERGNEISLLSNTTDNEHAPVIPHSLIVSPDEVSLTAELQHTVSETLTFTGTKPDSWRASPDIPAGLGFTLTSDDSSITLSIAPSERLTYSGILTLSGDYGTSADVKLMLSGIVSGEFALTPQTRTLELPAGGSETLSFSTVNGYGSVTWTAGTVTPSGVTLRLLQSENSKANFTASASENALGKYTAVITAADSAGRTASADITINVTQNITQSAIERLKREGKINQDGSPVVSFGYGGNFSATLQPGTSITRKISLGFNVSSWKVSMTILGGSTRVFTAIYGSDEEAVKITPESSTSAGIEVNTAGLSEGDYKLSLSVIPEGTAEETNAADLGTLKISSSSESNIGISSSSSGGCNMSALSIFAMLSCFTLFRKKS